jgi:hypothetical protein
MRMLAACLFLSLMMVTASHAQSASPSPAPSANTPELPAASPLAKLLEANVKTEWEAFKNKDKKAYSDLLADDFMAIEDDTQGMRDKYHAVGEIERSVVTNYNLFAFQVLPLNPNAALVTYELTMTFPPKALVRFKRVMVSELWLKREGQWKMRYYQETRVR